MATKQKKSVEKSEKAQVPNVTNNVPGGATQEDINRRVVSEPEQTFEERTSGNNQPWLNEDGSQNNG